VTFKQFPILFTYKKESEQKEKELTCYQSYNPYVKIVPHPELIGRCIMVDQAGMTDVAMAAEKLVEVFSA